MNERTGCKLRPRQYRKAVIQTELIKANYQSLIFQFRVNKVMLDADLASLYQIETKQLKRQVRRNAERFPEDFMFVLSKDEYTSLRSQFGTLKRGEHSKFLPMVFTEHGVAMLSSVINSPKAIKINIEIMRAFAQYRQILIENDSLKKEIKDLDDKLNKAFKYLLDRMDEMGRTNSERKPIGYKLNSKAKIKLKAKATSDFKPQISNS